MRMVAMAGLLALAGCATTGGDAGARPSGAGRCERAAGSALVGRAADAALGAEALRLTGARTLRWIRPGDMVTMDLRQDRVNVDLDAANRVADIRCG